ncbi:hypothetical protein BS330_22600 [Amycolatopsis keratiniphila subsp. nogabecina]|nr:hypothetical protein BS330_22600 [Amycolatopsis keratiniphila subsp. nogabecina]
MVFVAVAAVVVLVAAAVVPSVVPRHDQEQPAASPSLELGPSYVPSAGKELLAGPFLLATYVENGKEWRAVAFLVSDTAVQGSASVCTWYGPQGTPISAGQRGACYPLPAEKNPGDRLDVVKYELPHPGVWAFVAGAQVASLRVYNHDGSLANLTPAGAGGGYNVFSGKFERPTWFDAFAVNGGFLGSGAL